MNRSLASVAVVRDQAETAKRPRVLIISEAPVLVVYFASELRRHDLDVTCASDEPAVDGEPDVLLVDGTLARGLDVARATRAVQRQLAPVIFLAPRGTMTEQFPVLSRVGARVVPQPFSFEDLLIMLRSVLRALGALPESSRYLRYGDLEIDEESWDCRRAGNRIHLRPTEFRLVHALVAQAPALLAVDRLIDLVWDYDSPRSANMVQTYVSYVRKKLHAVGPPVLRTVRGVGYALDGDVQEVARCSATPKPRAPLALARSDGAASSVLKPEA